MDLLNFICGFTICIFNFHILQYFIKKQKKAFKEICRNYPDTAVLKGSGVQDPLWRKSRKSIYRYYDLGE